MDNTDGCPLRVIGVLDVKGGRAVHAAGGRREEYAPVPHAAGVRVDGDVVALAGAYVDACGIRELYLADLDAIERGVGALHSDLVAGVASLGTPVWVDAGTSTIADAQRVFAAGASVVVVGLETLASFDALAEICAGVGRDRVAFSVDLRDGRPVVMPNVDHSTATPPEIASRASRAGVRRLIVLDLARVGAGTGIDLELLVAIRLAAPEAALVAGGGVRDSADLEALRTAGCDGALVASALISGALTCNPKVAHRRMDV